MAVRKVSNRGGNIVGHFPSLKLGRMVAFESLIERDLVYLLDYEPAVEHFTEQPLVLRYRHQGKQRQYTPDFQVRYHGHPYLLECKPAALVDDPDNQLKFEAARRWCQRKGWTFAVVTDERLAANWRVINIKQLTQFARYTIGPEIKARIFAVLSATSHPMKVFDVMRQANPEEPQSAMIPILHMAFHHEVHIPLNEAPISVDSFLSLAGTGGESAGWLP